MTTKTDIESELKLPEGLPVKRHGRLTREEIVKLLANNPIHTPFYEPPNPPSYLKSGITAHIEVKSHVNRSGPRPFQNPTYPARTFGKIFVGANDDYTTILGTGAGVLVGANLVLTAGHTAPWGLPGAWMRFVPAYDDGNEPLGSSYVTNWYTPYGYNISNPPGADDCIICKLYTSLGTTIGWMGVLGFPTDNAYLTTPVLPVNWYVFFAPQPDSPQEQSEQAINDVQDDGQFKLLDTVAVEADPIIGGVMWINYESEPTFPEGPYVIGIASGVHAVPVDGVRIDEFGWAAGVGLAGVVLWGIENFK